MISHDINLNPYSPPAAAIEPVGKALRTTTRIMPRWFAIAWDATLLLIFSFYLPAMVTTTLYLFKQPIDLQTISRLPERWMLGFFLLSMSAYYAVQRHIVFRFVYGLAVVSFLFQHGGNFGDVITTVIAAAVFLPVFLLGYGWSGVIRVICCRITGTKSVVHVEDVENLSCVNGNA